MRRLLLILLWLTAAVAVAPAKAPAQGFVARTLSESLSGPGRTVVIEGFKGALSSRASIAKLTVADRAGVWLTLKNVVLDWNRAALLNGRIQVNQLTADEIDVARKPLPAAGAPPSATAPGFSLPKLPVTVNIGKLAARKVVLGAPILGAQAVVTVDGKMNLSGGAGAADLSIRRTDGQRGDYLLKTSYDNGSGKLTLDLSVDEAAGGLVSRALRLPGAPAISLKVAGAGPLSSFTARINLSSDGQPRLAGTVRFRPLKPAAGTSGNGAAKAGSAFSADVSGDIAPFLAPQFRAFFGRNIALSIAGSRTPDGVLSLDRLSLSTAQMNLQGRAVIGPDGLPKSFAVQGRIADPSGARIRLPLSGPPSTIRQASLRLSYDAAQGTGWQGALTLDGLNRPDLTVRRLTLGANGTLASPGTTPAVAGDVAFTADALQMTDPALAQALGNTLRGGFRFAWTKGKPLSFDGLSFDGANFALTGAATLADPARGLDVTGRLKVQSADLAPFSKLAGRPLGGSARAFVAGHGRLLAGSFDASAEIFGTGLKTGDARLNALLSGDSHISLTMQRDTTGTRLPRLRVTARSLDLSASGKIAPKAIDLTASLDFGKLADLGAGYGGSLTAQLAYHETAGAGRLGLTGRAQNLALRQPRLDSLLRGATNIRLDALRKAGRFTLERFSLSNPALSAEAAPAPGGNPETLAVQGRLADLASIAPGFPGPASLHGTIGKLRNDYRLALTATGPGALQARLDGTLATDFSRADLQLSGSAEAGIVNGMIAPRTIRGPVNFALAINGKPGLDALSGRITLGPARLVSPILGVNADGLRADVTLRGGRGQITASATVGGGSLRLSGPVALQAPFTSAIRIDLANVLLKDPALFSTRVNGTLDLAGPLLGGAKLSGALRLDQTELRVPSSGLGGNATIPPLSFTGETAAQRATRARAGVGVAKGHGGRKAPGGNGGAGAPAANNPIALDVTVSAPNRIFIRGRGLDAELGGTVALRGTTADIVPSGGFDLIRGRLDILGKRFALSRASLRLEGRFVPYVDIAASTVNDGVTSTISITGNAQDPQISFSSAPPLPQEEVLSQLLFGHGIAAITPFQAAQLASAVATLAGKGGEGIVGRIRKQFGLDNLDITSGANGSTALKLGKYISRKVYTELSVGSDGNSDVSLNLDVSPSVTIRGKAGSDGKTGIGIFFKRDY